MHSNPTENGIDDGLADLRDRLVACASGHVAFDGWSSDSLRSAANELQIPMNQAVLAFPNAGPDMAAWFHRAKDRALSIDLADTDLDAMRIRDRITHCVRRRIELVAADREAVRRSAALFSLPTNAPTGARLVWETADRIWTLCGDTSEDYNWYTKRMILSGVYSSTMLYWLGDQDPRQIPTWEFLDRRIEDVMRFERTKSRLKSNPLARAIFAVPQGILSRVRAPERSV